MRMRQFKTVIYTFIVAKRELRAPEVQLGKNFLSSYVCRRTKEVNSKFSLMLFAVLERAYGLKVKYGKTVRRNFGW